jgi:DNA-binding GntR family transcriptional regulator
MTQESSIQPIISAGSIRTQVERALTAVLVSGELGPGELVSVPSLAVQFGVSATPVREAMIEMERRGFVEAVRNKGFRVTSVSEEDLLHIADVRQMLEPPAMRLLAGHFPEERLAEFEQLAAEIVEGARTGDLRRYLEMDRNFHLDLTAMLGNPLLVELIGDLLSRTRMLGLHSMVQSDTLMRSAGEHAELLTLLVDGDANGARELMERHIGHTVGWWAGRPE